MRDVQAVAQCSHFGNVNVGDQLETWTVLKPLDGFKTGRTAL